MTAFYNEIDAYPAQWTRNLIAAGLVAPGEVDERSIKDLTTDDVRGFTQAHFFSGIAVWSHALRLAGWPDSEPVWTGSCPCQPFSQAGAGKGIDDERHLWPDWFKLIRKCRPSVIFGEQVGSPAGLEWLDAVHADLEGEGYAVGVADLSAAGVGAPHIRQRLYFGAVRLADDDDDGREVFRGAELPPDGNPSLRHDVDRRGPALGLGYSSSSSRGGRDSGAILGAEAQGSGERLPVGHLVDESLPSGATDGLGHLLLPRLERLAGDGHFAIRRARAPGPAPTTGPTRGFWGDADWLYCQDEKWRPVEPGTFPMAHGAPARVGRIRATGNAIVPQVAAAFIRAFAGAVSDLRCR